jgi:hypothetical protein
MKLSKSALFYRKNRASREAKKDYDTEYHSTPERKKYRAELNKARRKRHLKGDSRDLSHRKDGKLVLENRSANRARNHSDGKSSLK